MKQRCLTPLKLRNEVIKMRTRILINVLVPGSPYTFSGVRNVIIKNDSFVLKIIIINV